ncbi:endolytic transglycosylase MltG [Acetobacterium paludosum]|uniref:Endolytic murein transglycosylase n=1 Tax=Acetobacterium paludosum TaxID=52693 RepID=A0A923HTM5_9FIRM|nr:endolytic transglycosylase MltG [Acetobacterium paludosum]MBC3886977.1 endolytic transglycosylase MltG [Acetobacterium paludosum]
MRRKEKAESKLPGQPSSPKRGKFIAIILLLLIVFASTAVFSFNYFMNEILKPVGDGDLVYVRIEEGAVISEVADLLEKDHLIKDALAFEVLAKNKNMTDQIQSGYYAFSPSEPAEQILERLVAGDVYDSAVTIPEGENIEEIAAILEKNHVCDGDAFIAETKKVAEYQKKYPILSSIPLETKDGVSRTLEGYLFPDTYSFTPESDPSAVVDAMLDRFVEVYDQDYLNRTTEMGKTVDQIVIMSSIVELETKYVEDKANVASVFYNRIAANMPLQSDITVDYARGEKTAVLTTEETQFASPYNTYINLGLPFGPICSFGKTSLEAALYPATTKYLYFVADMTSGKIYFNETYEEHLADVETYLGGTN